VDLDVSIADEPVPLPAGAPVAWRPAAAPATAAKATMKEVAVSPSARAAASSGSTTPKQAPEGPSAHADHASAGVVVVSEPAPTSGRHAGPPLPAGLQERLQSACGSRAEVHAVARSATNLGIELKARNAAEAERLTNILLNFPELRPFKVDFDVTLVP
jgi:hypothetical protein